MDLERKLDILGGGATTEVLGMRAGRPLRRGFKTRWVYHAAGPGGRPVRLMSLLMTNACSFTCTYCATRRDRNLVRTAVTPDELARTFAELVQADQADGLFLTSGIPGRPAAMMDRMLAAVELIRQRYRFAGYLHLKILPGAEPAQVERACALASRVSINLEAPSEDRLRPLAPEKSLQRQILPVLDHVNRLRAAQEPGWPTLVPAGVTSQLIVGAGGDSDRELLQVSTRLLRERRLTRTHFSAFQPVQDTPLENQPATSFVREHRLYQAEFLLRTYGFALEDLSFDDAGRLNLGQDPKWIWAVSHPEQFPVDLLRADREWLLRVPGIGPRSAARIVAQRRSGSLRSLDDLRRLGVVVKRARGFILLGGRRFEMPRQEEQAAFVFETASQPHRALPCANGLSPCAFR
jgi:predicted DNA-binding helix-hairpin-helix protein